MPYIALHCKHCAHLFMEHDDYGCRHSACSCTYSQHHIINNNPVPRAPEPIDPIDDKSDDYKAKRFTKEYFDIRPEELFSALAKSLQEMPFFKVWRVDKDSRYIDMTTYSLRVNTRASNSQEQVYVKVLEGQGTSSSVVKIKITPTLIGIFTLYDICVNVQVSEKSANNIADLIFGAIVDNSKT